MRKKSKSSRINCFSTVRTAASCTFAKVPRCSIIGPRGKRVHIDAAELRWPDLPLDIYRLIIDSSPPATLRMFCLVSKMSYAFAMPLLYRDISLTLEDFNPDGFSAGLKSIVKGSYGKYVKSIDLQANYDWEMYEPEHIHDPMKNALVEIALDKMTNLTSFNWNCYTINKDIIAALQKCPLETLKINFEMFDWDSRAFHVTDLGKFKKLKNLELTNISGFHMLDEVRQILRSCPIENLKFSLSEIFWEVWYDNEDRFDLFEETKDTKKKEIQPGKTLKSLEISDYRLDTCDMFQLVDNSPYFFRPNLRHLDRVSLHAPLPQILNLLSSSEALHFRYLCIHKCPSVTGAISNILKHSQRLEQLYLSFGSQSTDNQLLRRLLGAICEVAPQGLKELALLCCRDCQTIPTMPIKSCNELGRKVPSLQQLVLSADCTMGETPFIGRLLATELRNLKFFKIQRDKAIPSPRVSQPSDHVNVANIGSLQPGQLVPHRQSLQVSEQGNPTATKKALASEQEPGRRDDLAAAIFKSYVGTDMWGKGPYLSIDDHVYQFHTIPQNEDEKTPGIPGSNHSKQTNPADTITVSQTLARPQKITRELRSELSNLGTGLDGTYWNDSRASRSKRAGHGRKSLSTPMPSAYVIEEEESFTSVEKFVFTELKKSEALKRFEIINVEHRIRDINIYVPSLHLSTSAD